MEETVPSSKNWYSWHTQHMKKNKTIECCVDICLQFAVTVNNDIVYFGGFANLIRYEASIVWKKLIPVSKNWYSWHTQHMKKNKTIECCVDICLQLVVTVNNDIVYFGGFANLIRYEASIVWKKLIPVSKNWYSWHTQHMKKNKTIECCVDICLQLVVTVNNDIVYFGGFANLICYEEGIVWKKLIPVSKNWYSWHTQHMKKNKTIECCVDICLQLVVTVNNDIVYFGGFANLIRYEASIVWKKLFPVSKNWYSWHIWHM